MKENRMAKILGTIIGICIVAILIAFIPTVAQDNPTGLQSDDVEIYVSGGVSITLQGDDVEIYTDKSTITANPLAIMQGDDTEVFTILETTDNLQGDDVEIFNAQSELDTSAISSQTETVDIIDLSTSLPTANLDVLNQLSDTVNRGLPEMNHYEWEANSRDSTFLIIGGGISGILILIAIILILSVSVKNVQRSVTELIRDE